MSNADNPDWTTAFGGNVNFVADAQSLIANQPETLQPGLNSIGLTVPAGTASMKVWFLATDTGGSNQTVRLAIGGEQAGGIQPAEYVDLLVPGTGANFAATAVVDTQPGNTYVFIYNFGPTAIAGQLTVAGYGVPAAQVKADPDYAADYWWIGWECSNCNVFNPAVTISRPNFQIPIEQNMMLLGLYVSASAAIGETNPCKFWETLYAGGFWRQADGVPFAIGGDAANPSGPTEAAFGAPAADTNVNFGPPSGHKNTLFSGIMKQSNQEYSSPTGDRDRITMDGLRIPLWAGDGLWFHAGGQTDSGSTTAVLDFEMQLVVKYALIYD